MESKFMPNTPTHSIPPEALKDDYPAQVFTQEYRPPEYLAYLERAAAAVQTMRLVVFASLACFVLLAAYGFFLIYELTVDTHRMVDQTVRMTEQMQSMTRIMGNMHESIVDMRTSIAAMQETTAHMDVTMTTLASTTAQMANTVALIQHSARNLDASVGPAANAMNSFLPFGGGGYPGAPPFAPPVR